MFDEAKPPDARERSLNTLALLAARLAMSVAARAALLLGLGIPRSCLGWTTGGAPVLASRRRRAVAATIVNCASSGDAPVPFSTAFQLDLDGDQTCVAVWLPDARGAVDLAALDLHKLECDFATVRMQPLRQTFFAGGRVAMRRALTVLGADAAASEPILMTDEGAPKLAPDVLGSISHTRGLALAVAATRPPSQAAVAMAVGVDVESTSRSLSPRAATRCLHEAERQTLGRRSASEGVADANAVAADLLLRVSIKEALYKAVHPLVPSSMRWHSVQVYPHEDGACDVVCDELERDLGARLDVSASWRVCEGFYVSTASATLLTPPVAKDPRGQRGCHGVAVGL